MSVEIDERIVEMRFDNRQFEDGVKTSLGTIEQLKSNLNFSGVAKEVGKSFEDIGGAVNKCDLSTIGKSVDAAAKKFSILDTIAVGSLLKIGSQAVTAGEKILKAFTIDNISAGWKKFVDKTNSVSTLIAQGYDMSTVEEQLKRLNWFTDETSFEFTEMVSSIAKFTAAGQGLESSVTALEGIANWAALSGQNAATASRAMYQLSQAMGAGVMRKEDYKSIQNVSMDTTEFRQKAIEAAIELKTLKQNADGTYQSLRAGTDAFTLSQFADHLTKDAWFTSDVMMKVYNEYSSAVDQIYEYAESHHVTASQAIEELGDKVSAFGLKAFKAAQEARSWQDVVGSIQDAVSTGWMNTFEIIFGNYEEQRVLWTDLANTLYDVFAEPVNEMNYVLYDAFSSGFTKFMDALATTGVKAEDFKQTLHDIADRKGIVLDDIISEYGSLEKAIQAGAISSDMLKEAAIESIKALTGIDEIQLEDIRTFNAHLDELLENVDKLGGRQHLWSAFWNTWESVGTILGTIGKAFSDIFSGASSEGIFNMLKGLDELTNRFKLFLTESETGQRILKDLTNIFKGLFAIVDIAGRGVGEVLKNIIGPLLGAAKGPVGSFLLFVLDTLGMIGEMLANIDAALREEGNLLNGFLNPLSDFINSIKLPKMPSFDFKAPSFEFKLPEIKPPALNIPAFEKVNDELETTSTVMAGIPYNANQATYAVNNFASQTKGAVKTVDIGSGLQHISDALVSFMEKAKPVVNFLFGEEISLKGGLQGFANLIISGGFAVGMLKIVGVFEKFAKTTKDIAETTKGLITSVESIPKNIADVVKSFGDIGKGVTEVLDELKNCLKAYQTEIKARALVKIAIAIAILAGALFLLSKLSGKELFKSLVGLTVLFAELTALLIVLTKNDFTSLKSSRITTIMLGLSIAISILSSALKKIGSIDIDNLIAAVFSIGVLINLLYNFIKKIDALLILDIKPLLAVGLMLIEMGVALDMIAIALKVMGSIRIDRLLISVASIGALLGALYKFTVGIESIKGFSAKTILSMGLALMEMSFALVLIATSMKILGSMNLGEIGKGLMGIGGFFIIFSQYAKSISKLEKVNMAKLFMLGISLNLLASAMMLFGKLKIGDIIKSVASVASMLGVVFGILNAAKNLDMLKNMGFLISFAITVKLVADAFKNFESLSWDNILKAIISLSASLITFSLAAKLLSGVSLTVKGVIGAFVAFGAVAYLISQSVVIMARGIKDLGEAVATLDSEAIANNIIAIARAKGRAMVEFFAGLADSSELLRQSASTILKTITDIFIEWSVVFTLEMLEALSTYTPLIVDKFTEFFVKLCDGLTKNMPEIARAFSGLMDSFFTALFVTDGKIDVDKILKLNEAVGIIAAVTIALGKLKVSIPMAAQGAVAIGAVITILSGIILGLGALFTKLDELLKGNLDSLMSEGVKIFRFVGEAIGELIGGIAGGITSGYTASLIEVAKNLSEFTKELQPFLKDVSGITGESINGAFQLLKMLVVISGADAYTKIMEGFFGKVSFKALGKKFKAFGGAMGEFSESIKDISTKDIGRIYMAGKAGEALGVMVKSFPNSGGLFSWLFTGNNDADSFGSKLEEFGTSLGAFSESVKDLTPDDITQLETVARIGTAIGEMAKSFPDVGGLSEKIEGDGSIATVGSQLEEFGKSLVVFSALSNELDESDVEQIEKVITISTKIADMAALFPEVGGLGEIFKKNNSLSRIGLQLETFGTGLASFSTSVSDITDDDIAQIEKITPIGTKIGEMAASIPEMEGQVSSVMTGGKSLTLIGTQLPTFAQGLKLFSNSISEITDDDITQIEKITTIGTKIADMAAAIPEMDGAVAVFEGGKSLGIITDQLPPFGRALVSFSGSASEITDDDITNIGRITGATDTIATFMPSLTSATENLPDVGKVIALYMVAGTFEQLGSSPLVAFGTAIKKYGDSVKGIDSVAIDDSVTAITSITDFSKSVTGFNSSKLNSFKGSLEGLGESLTDFYNDIKGINTGRLSAAVDNLTKISDLSKDINKIDTKGIKDLGAAFETLASNSIDEFVTEFEGSSEKIEGAISTMFTKVSEALVGSESITASAMSNVVTSLVTSIGAEAETVSTAFSTLIRLGGAAIVNESQTSISPAIKNVLTKVVETIKSFQKAFTEVGGYIATGLAIGMLSKQTTVRIAGATLAKSALEAAKRALNSRSPSREFIHLGENVGEGMAIGIHNNIIPAAEASAEMSGEVITAAKKGLDKFKDWLSEKQYYGEISSVEELAGWEQLQKQYKEGSKERKEIDREVYRVQNKIVEDTYQHSINWIEKEKEMYGRSTEWELAQYEKIQHRYLWGSKERMEIDEKMYGLRKQLIEESYQNSLDWIQEQDDYDRSNLASKLSDQLRLINKDYMQEDDWAETRKKHELEVYKLEKEIYEARKKYIEDVEEVQTEAFEKRKKLEEDHKKQVEDINKKLSDDIQKLEDQYTQNLENRVKSLYNAFGLFDEVKEREEVSMSDLLDNITGQNKELNEWGNYLDELTARGVDPKLVQELRELGPSAIAQVKALAKSSDAELSRFQDAWKAKWALTREFGVEEMKGARKETDEQIAQLRIDAQAEIDKAEEDYLKSLDDLDKETNKKLDKLKQDFGEKVGLIKKDTEKEMKEMTEVAKEILLAAGWDESGQAIVDGIIDGVRKEAPKLLDEIEQLALEGAKTSWEGEPYETVKRPSSYLSGVAGGATANSSGYITNENTFRKNVTDSFKGIINDATGKANSIFKPTMLQIAKNGLRGFILALEEGKERSAAIAALANLVQTSTDNVKRILGIRSPSRVFMEIGEFTVLGFVKGLKDYADKSYEAASNVGEEAKFGLSDAMQTIIDYLNGDLEICIRIRPVIDGSDMDLASERLSDYINRSKSIELMDIAKGQVDEWNRLNRLYELKDMVKSTFNEYKDSLSDNSSTVINVNNDNVIQELRSLRADAADMIYRMENLQIVLDSGKLVGETVGKMDYALGRRQSYRGRGI